MDQMLIIAKNHHPCYQQCRLLSRTLLFILLLLITTAAFGCNTEDNKQTKTNSTDTLSSTQVDSFVIELIGIDSLTVLELLQREHHVTGQTSAMGYFVSSIDSISSSRETFWIYTVNDNTPSVACDRYVCTEGDIIKWHLKKSN